MDRLLDQDHILKLAEKLWSARPNITTDHVDGAFYWWGCRAGEFPNPTTTHVLAWDAAQRWKLETEAPDYFLWSQQDRFPQMRSAWIRYIGGPTRYPNDISRRERLPGSLLVGVSSPDWQGADVADRVYSWISDRGSHPEIEVPDLYPDPPYPDTFASTRIRMWFRESGAFRMPSIVDNSIETIEDRMPPLPLAFPFVMLAIDLPIPPYSVIEANYDAIAIEERKWQERLIGSQSRQTVEVAIRTWAVALLVATGVKHWVAMSDVQTRLEGMRGVSQPRHGEDRALLLRRVPEAQIYLSRL